MRKLRKNLFGIFWGLYACFLNTPHVMAANGDITALQGSGTYNNVDVFRIDSNANVFISSYNASNFNNVPHTTISNQGLTTHTGDVTITGVGDINFGSITVAQSTTNTTGAGIGNVYSAFLASGTSIAAGEGSVICATTSQQGNLITANVCPAVFNTTTWVGIADGAASTGTVVNILSAGAWALALTTGTVNPGDMLIVSAKSQGFLEATTLSTNSVVGIALGSGPSAGGLTRIRLR